MAYATLEDVRGKIPQLRLDASSKPNEADVQEWLDTVESSLDSMLTNLGYQSPVILGTSPKSFMILRDMVASEIASQVIISQVSGVRDPNDLGAKVLHEVYCDRVKSLIDPKHPFSLPDAGAVNLDTKLEGDISGLGMDSSFLDAPTITRDQVF